MAVIAEVGSAEAVEAVVTVEVALTVDLETIGK